MAVAITLAWSASMSPAANAALVATSPPDSWSASSHTCRALARRAVNRSASQAVVEVAPTVLARSRRVASPTAVVCTAAVLRNTSSAAVMTSATAASSTDHNVRRPGSTSSSNFSANRRHNCATGCPAVLVGWSLMEQT